MIDEVFIWITEIPKKKKKCYDRRVNSDSTVEEAAVCVELRKRQKMT